MLLADLGEEPLGDERFRLERRKEDRVFKPGMADQKPLQRLRDRGKARVINAEAFQRFPNHAMVLEQLIRCFQHRRPPYSLFQDYKAASVIFWRISRLSSSLSG